MNELYKPLQMSTRLWRNTTRLFLLSTLLLSCVLTSCRNKYGGPQYEAELYQMLDDYSVKYCKQNNMDLIHIGDFSYPDEHLMYGLWFRSYSSVTLEEGRAYAVTFVNDLVSMLQNNDIATTHFEQTKRFYSPNNSVVDRSLVGLKIAYWDKNVNRPNAPYLAEVIFCKDSFRYYEADAKTQALTLILEESYDNAIKKHE